MKPKHWVVGLIIVVATVLLLSYEEDQSATDDSINTAASFIAEHAAIAKGFVDVEGGIIYLAAQRDGVIDKVYVEEGDRVEANQILATQNIREAELHVNQAKAEITASTSELLPLNIQLHGVKRDIKRITRLVEENAASQQELDERQDQLKLVKAQLAAKKATIEMAKARLAIAEHEMSLRTVRAPMNGSIVRRLAQPGAGLSIVNVSTLFWFTPDTPVIVRAEVEERFVSRITVGMQALIVPENDESANYAASVSRIGLIFGPKRPSSYDPEQRSDVRVVEVVLNIENETTLLLGQRVIVKFIAP